MARLGHGTSRQNVYVKRIAGTSTAVDTVAERALVPPVPLCAT